LHSSCLILPSAEITGVHPSSDYKANFLAQVFKEVKKMSFLLLEILKERWTTLSSYSLVEISASDGWLTKYALSILQL
jgi:hypothetical protein